MADLNLTSSNAKSFSSGTTAAADESKSVVGAIAHLQDKDELCVSSGTAFIRKRQNVVLQMQAGVDAQVGNSKAAVVYGYGIAPFAGTVVAVKAVASAITDTASLAIQNLDLTAGAGDICSAFPALANSTEGTVVSGTLHGTAANLVVNAGDRFQLKLTTDGSGTIDDLTVMVVIESDLASETAA